MRAFVVHSACFMLFDCMRIHSFHHITRRFRCFRSNFVDLDVVIVESWKGSIAFFCTLTFTLSMITAGSVQKYSILIVDFSPISEHLLPFHRSRSCPVSFLPLRFTFIKLPNEKIRFLAHLTRARKKKRASQCFWNGMLNETNLSANHSHYVLFCSSNRLFFASAHLSLFRSSSFHCVMVLSLSLSLLCLAPFLCIDNPMLILKWPSVCVRVCSSMSGRPLALPLIKVKKKKNNLAISTTFDDQPQAAFNKSNLNVSSNHWQANFHLFRWRS